MTPGAGGVGLLPDSRRLVRQPQQAAASPSPGRAAVDTHKVARGADKWSQRVFLPTNVLLVTVQKYPLSVFTVSETRPEKPPASVNTPETENR